MTKTYPVYTTIAKEPHTTCEGLEEGVFQYPFFSDGVSSTKTNPRAKSDLDSIEVKPDQEELELKGLIFHSSHCGSTLLGRMLNQTQSVRVVNESEAINGLLLSKKLYAISDDTIAKQLKKIIRLYQQKVGTKQYLIIKFTSWNVYFIDLILNVFPTVKWVYLDRETESLLKSLKTKSGGFIDWWDHPVDELRKHFIASDSAIQNKDEYLREMIRGHRLHANRKKDDHSIFLEYPTFIQDYKKIFNHFDLESTEEEEALLQEVIKYDSKSMENKLWTGNQ